MLTERGITVYDRNNSLIRYVLRLEWKKWYTS